MGIGFTYHRHCGFIYDRELTHEEWVEIAVELDDNGWIQDFHSFDTNVIGKINDLRSVISEGVSGEGSITLDS